jgi:hypothetical protein
VQAKVAEIVKGEVLRIYLPRTPLNKSMKARVQKSRISHCFVANSLQIHRRMFSLGGL